MRRAKTLGYAAGAAVLLAADALLIYDLTATVRRLWRRSRIQAVARG